MIAAFDIAVPGPAVLGEGPTWDPATGRLLWVDILSCEIHAYDPADGTDAAFHTGQHVGAAKPRSGGGIVANLRDGIGLYDSGDPGRRGVDAGGAFRWLARLPEEGVRGNDAAVGPDGALWAGTMRYDERPGGGRLRRVDPQGGVTTVLDEVTISNGIGWSPDARLMYYVDTPTRRIDVVTHDGPVVRERRPFAVIPGPGKPDGLTVDAAGCVWVALWGAGRVLRITPGGTIDRTIELPATLTTACAFGGADLRDLYVTTASVGLPASRGSSSPDGALLVIPNAGEGLVSPAFPG